jgi:hypothetical protein
VSALIPFTEMGDELEKILAAQRVPAHLCVVYDDMHGLWGGSILTVQGDGRLERQVRSRGAPAPTSSTRQVDQREVLALIRLLVELFAWKQHTPDSPPIPDESRAYLTISLGERTSRMWERYNDMQANDRLIHVKRWIESQFGGETQDAPTE